MTSHNLFRRDQNKHFPFTSNLESITNSQRTKGPRSNFSMVDQELLNQVIEQLILALDRLDNGREKFSLLRWRERK